MSQKIDSVPFCWLISSSKACGSLVVDGRFREDIILELNMIVRNFYFQTRDARRWLWKSITVH